MSTIKSIYNIEAEKLINENKDLLILDVRTLDEFRSGKIENAINIAIDEIDLRIKELAPYKNKEILVYCKVGVRSSIVCNFLENEGFKNLYNLSGGILDYTGKIVE